MMMNNNILINTTDFKNATGTLKYNMTNDYMFRAVLQTNNKVLRGLICSLLHLSEEEINSVIITNPIILGESLNDKEFRLDINVILNDNTLINLEMQIANKLNWRERSVSYLCRSYDQVTRGHDYNEIKPVIHIGFLDYTMFPEHPEFYATYKLMNIKKHHIYSDKLTLSVIDLTQINLATKEDKFYYIDYWASLFKATTWEEMKMLAEKNEYLSEASNTIFHLSADEQIQKRCRDREEYYQDLKAYENAIAQKDRELQNAHTNISKQQEIIQNQAEEISALKAKLATYEKK